MACALLIRARVFEPKFISRQPAFTMHLHPIAFNLKQKKIAAVSFRRSA